MSVYAYVLPQIHSPAINRNFTSLVNSNLNPWRECFISDHQCLQQTGLATYSEPQQRQLEAHKDFIEVLAEGVLWEMGCNRHGSNIYSRHDIWEGLSCPCIWYSHLCCWAYVVLCVYTNDMHVCFSLSAQFLCCSYMYSLRSMHNLLIVYTCTDCTCLTQARPQCPAFR